MYQTMDQEIMFRELVGERYAAMEQAAKIEHALQRVRAKHPGFWRRLIGRILQMSSLTFTQSCMLRGIQKKTWQSTRKSSKNAFCLSQTSQKKMWQSTRKSAPG